MPSATDPALVAQAEELLGGGASPSDVAVATGLSRRSCYRIAARLTSSPAEDAAPGAVPVNAAAKPTSGASGDLAILDEEIEATRGQLREGRAKARAGGSTHGLASLGTLLTALLKRRAEVRPPEPVDAAGEERRWRADADRVLQAIEAGVRAAEEQHGVAAPVEAPVARPHVLGPDAATVPDSPPVAPVVAHAMPSRLSRFQARRAGL